MLESGDVKSLKEIAALEGVDNSYVSRMVNLTTLAPDIVAAILADNLPDHITLFELAVDPSCHSQISRQPYRVFGLYRDLAQRLVALAICACRLVSSWMTRHWSMMSVKLGWLSASSPSSSIAE